MDYLFRGGKRPHGNHPNQARLLIIRQAALDRDKRCRVCGNDNKDELQGHHINYRSYGAESVEDLTILCKGCHQAVHQRMDIVTNDFFDDKPSDYELGKKYDSNLKVVPDNYYQLKISKANCGVSGKNNKYIGFLLEIMSEVDDECLHLKESEHTGAKFYSNFWISNNYNPDSGWKKLRELCVVCDINYDDITTSEDLIMFFNHRFIAKVEFKTSTKNKPFAVLSNFKTAYHGR